MSADRAGGAIHLPPIIEFAVQLVRKSASDRLLGLAAESAFFAVLSVFPGLLLIAAALGSLDSLVGAAVAERSEAVVLEFLSHVLTDRAAGVTETVRDLFVQERGGVLTTALLGGLWVLSRGFAAVIRALDLIYGLRERRSWFRLLFTQLCFALGSVIMLAVVLAMVVVGPFLGHGQLLAERHGLGHLFSFAWDWLRAPVAFALLVVWAATLYRLGPSHLAPWTRGLPGALTAGLLWLLVTFGFRVYLSMVASVNEVFGLLGGGLILLVWLYLLSFALFIGGQLNVVLIDRHDVRRP
jgi:membrane protein